MSLLLTKLDDTYRHKGLRNKLVEIIKEKGITNEAVLNAIGKLPRHFFFDSAFMEYAYEDKAFQIGSGQTISQPYTVAYQSQLLDVQPRDKILEVGTGSGYQACILSMIGAKVFTIERHKKLNERAKTLLDAMHVGNIKFFYGDGFEGLPLFAPFDKVLITAAAPELPSKLLAQLKTGGKLVMPYGKGKVQKMQCITKVDDNHFEKEEFDNFQFVPMLKGKVW